MIRSSRDPGPGLLGVVVLVCAVVLAALWLAGATASEGVRRLDEHVRQQVETATCPTDAPVRPTTCEPRP